MKTYFEVEENFRRISILKSNLHLQVYEKKGRKQVPRRDCYALCVCFPNEFFLGLCTQIEKRQKVTFPIALAL